MMNDVLRLLHERGLRAGQLRLRPAHLSEILQLVEEKRITVNTGKALLERVEESGRAPGELVAAEGLAQVSDADTLRTLGRQVVEANPEQAAAYRGGKETLIGWFVGQVMRASGGKADPNLARAILEELLRG
jgi:aspartyl-tRNA(Asn)/glutamyl-tRNA(Gln) amidotransferase subunit B